MFFGSSQKISDRKRAESYVATTVHSKGDIFFADSMFFEGVHSGNLANNDGKKGILILGKNAKIKGDIKVTKVIVMGQVEGNIYSDGLVTLMPGSKVQGDIYYKDVDMRHGASVSGSFCHTGGKPQKTLESGSQSSL